MSRTITKAYELRSWHNELKRNIKEYTGYIGKYSDAAIAERIAPLAEEIKAYLESHANLFRLEQRRNGEGYCGYCRTIFPEKEVMCVFDRKVGPSQGVILTCRACFKEKNETGDVRLAELKDNFGKFSYEVSAGCVIDLPLKTSYMVPFITPDASGKYNLPSRLAIPASLCLVLDRAAKERSESARDENVTV